MGLLGAPKLLSMVWRRQFAVLLALTLAALALLTSDALAQSPPGTPSSVSLIRADGVLRASWDAVPGAATYHVTYSSDGGTSWSLAALRHTGTSIVIGVSNDAAYVVGVRARNEHGDSGWRNSPTIGPYKPKPIPDPGPRPDPPETPSSVSLTRADGTLTASWDAVSGATGYHVTYSSDGGASWSLAALDHTGTSITIDNISNSATYVVGVRAGNSDGWGGWRNSPAIGPYTPPTTPPPPPAVPSGLAAQPSHKSVALTWDDPSDSTITRYEYRYRAAPPAPGWGAWTPVPNSDSATTSVRIAGLTNGTEYRFKLRSVNAGGSSNPAPAAAPWYVSATPGQVTPAAPTGLEATAGEGSATITWKNPGDASITGYQYQQREDGGAWGENTPIEGSGAGTTSHQVNGLASGTTYHFNLQALNASGASAAAQTKVTLPGLIPGPASITITRSTGALNATWTASPGAYRYWVYTDDSGDGHFVRTLVGTPASNSITVTGVNDSLNYRVALYARTENSGRTEWAVSAPAGTLTSPPVAPTWVGVSRSGGALAVSWPAMVGAASYNVNISGDHGQTWARQATAHTTNSWTVPTIDADTSYILSVQTVNTAGTSGWTNSSVNTPAPPAPASVTVASRSGTTLNASWAAVTGAASYNVRTSDDDGLTWSASSSVTTGTTKALTIDATKDYFVGVQAVNAKGTSGWTVSSESHATPLPAAPSNVADTRAKGSITLTWDAATGAASYDVACNAYETADLWQSCKTGITDANRSATFTQYYNPHQKKMRPIVDTRSYDFAVRARNASGVSEWTRYTAWPAAPHRIASINVASHTASGITLSWTMPAANGGYPATYVSIQCRTSTDAGTTWSSWFYCSDQSGLNYTPGSTFTTVVNSVDGYNVSLTYQARARAQSPLGLGEWRESAVIDPLTSLTATAVTVNSATLTIAHHTGNWYANETAPTVGTCSSAITGTSTNLSSLTAGTWYTYKAYSDAACTTANELAVETFSTAVTVSNLSEGDSYNQPIGYSNTLHQTGAQGFTTGSNPGGYTLSGISVTSLAKMGSPANLVVKLHAASGNNTPGTELATLSGSNPDTAGTHAYTCSTGCDLAAGATYHVALSAPNSPSSGPANSYMIKMTASNNETKTPSSNGWSIADVGWVQPGINHLHSFKIQVYAQPKPGLVASSVTFTTATLTLTGHAGKWWLKKTSPTPAGTCTAGAADLSHDLTALTEGTTYTYKAYGDSGCTTANEIAAGTFTTLALPTGVAASASKGGVSVTWTAPGMDRAQVRTRPTSGGNWSAAVDPVVNADASPARIIGLTAGTAVDVELRVFKGANHSAWVSAGSATPLATTAPSGAAQNVSLVYANNKMWLRFDFPTDDGGLPLTYQFDSRVQTNHATLNFGTTLDTKAGAEADKTYNGTTYDVVYYFDQWKNFSVHGGDWQSICKSGHNFRVTRISVLVKNASGNGSWLNLDLTPHVHSGCD